MRSLLLAVSAAVEVATGLALLAMPSAAAHLLLGGSLDGSIALVAARVAGAGLLSLGIACWLTRTQGDALVTSMLVYNVVAVVILLHGFLILGLSGELLWPTAILHATLAIWCVLCLRSRGQGT